MHSDEFDEIEDEYTDDESEEIIDPGVSRVDKIFNNRYNTGDGLSDGEDYSYSKKIAVSSEYSDAYLKDIYEYEEALESKFILDSIFNFLQEDPELISVVNKASSKSRLAKSNVAKTKLSKDDVNFIFVKINQKLEVASHASNFYNPIYILEAISSISSIEYRKLFDMLDTDIQEILLTELNKKYQFLDGKMHKKRIH